MPAATDLSRALSLCMIVKNAAQHLAACLDSVAGLADELILADTGSTDETALIAGRYGAIVVPFDFTVVDFAAARNHAIAHAGGRWILVLDADETLDPASVPLIRSIILAGDDAGYFVERHNHSSSGGPAKDYAVRLFPNRTDYRYRGRVHETVDASILATGGKLHTTAIRIDHKFSTDAEARRRRNLWYIEILKEEIAADPADVTRLDFLAAEYHQLGMFGEATETAERIARMRPLDARAHLFAGVYHLVYKPDFAQARADFDEALRLRPGYPEALSFLATLDEKERAALNLTRPV